MGGALAETVPCEGDRNLIQGTVKALARPVRVRGDVAGDCVGDADGDVDTAAPEADTPTGAAAAEGAGESDGALVVTTKFCSDGEAKQGTRLDKRRGVRVSSPSSFLSLFLCLYRVWRGRGCGRRSCSGAWACSSRTGSSTASSPSATAETRHEKREESRWIREFEEM